MKRAVLKVFGQVPNLMGWQQRFIEKRTFSKKDG